MKRLRRREKARVGQWTAGAACLLACAGVAAAQSRPSTVIVSSGSAAYDLNPRPDSGEVRREIRDPNTGTVWLLSLDAAHPGGPGRLVPAEKRMRAATGTSASESAESSEAQPVIRAGDRVTIEEDTPTVSARLEAIALGPASSGAPLRVRLLLGGHIVDGRALSSGRVAPVERQARQGAQQ